MLVFAFGYLFCFGHPYINSREQFILTMQWTCFSLINKQKDFFSCTILKSNNIDKIVWPLIHIAHISQILTCLKINRFILLIIFINKV